jgi:hypothetical protein
VDGEGPLNSEEWTPFLRTLQKFDTPVKSVSEIMDENKVEEARELVGEKRFAHTTSSAAVFQEGMDHQFWKEGVTPNIEGAKGKHVTVLSKESNRLQAELEMVSLLTEELLSKKRTAQSTKPVMVYSEVYGLENRESKLRSQSFSMLSTRIESLLQKINGRTSRPLFTVVFSGKRQGPAPNHVTTELVAEESRRLQSTTKKVPFQGSDYVIMFWTLVAFMILTFLSSVASRGLPPWIRH